MAEAADFQGTSPSPARRLLRRTAAVLTTAPLLAGLLQLTAVPPAQAAGQTSARAASGSGTVSVSLDSLSPAVPTEDDTLTVSGTVTNNGRQTITDTHVDLRLGPELDTRSGIDDAARGGEYVAGADGSEIGDDHRQKLPELTPGVAEHFSVSVPVEDLDLGDAGVYQLGVALSGETDAQQWDQVLGFQRTFLPWQPGEADTTTRTTFLWPLISESYMTAQTDSDEKQTPVFRNDDLTKELSPGGRLEQLVSLGKDLDITWVIDPDLLASVDAMTESYEVQGEGDTTTPGRGQSVANRWLAELQDAVEGKEIVALPFGDTDLASLAHNGTSVTGSLSHLKEATEAAGETVETVLHVKPSTDFAWPVNGAVDPSIVKVATSAGADTVIARSDSLQETDALSYTPSAPRPIGGGTTALVADARLSTAFQGDLTSASAGTLAVQRFLAQSLTVNLQTDKQRSVVVAPQRMPSATQAHTMAQALATLQGSPWHESQSLTEAAASRPDPEANTKVPSASSYPASLRRKELPRTAFGQIATTQEKLDNFQVILSDKSRVVTPFGRAMNREMSASWRGHVVAARNFRDGVERYLDDLADQVSLIDKSETKLSGRSATIPVTVQNNLVQGVEHLVLRLTSTSPTRLEIGGEAYDEQPVSVSGGHSQSVKFTTSANANGRVTVIAQLFTEDGEAYGDPVTFDVKVTEFTATVMLVIGGGVLLLVLAGFRMYTQRKRAAARGAEGDVPEDGEQPGEDGERSDERDEPAEYADALTADGAPEESTGGLAGTDGPQNTRESSDGPQNPEGPNNRLNGKTGESLIRSGADEPEQPSDPTPDTAAENTDPSGTGERVDR
ncbi:DUF6049 family protein [Streptomyces sp. NPDC093094]|uniref:DUF6049 family protein n=1 Tax=Streptomyces sp. NPDC093094 TaxID=3366026 RepID=UPI0037FB9385